MLPITIQITHKVIKKYVKTIFYCVRVAFYILRPDDEGIDVIFETKNLYILLYFITIKTNNINISS